MSKINPKGVKCIEFNGSLPYLLLLSPTYQSITTDPKWSTNSFSCACTVILANDTSMAPDDRNWSIDAFWTRFLRKSAIQKACLLNGASQQQPAPVGVFRHWDGIETLNFLWEGVETCFLRQTVSISLKKIQFWDGGSQISVSTAVSKKPWLFIRLSHILHSDSGFALCLSHFLCQTWWKSYRCLVVDDESFSERSCSWTQQLETQLIRSGNCEWRAVSCLLSWSQA